MDLWVQVGQTNSASYTVAYSRDGISWSGSASGTAILSPGVACAYSSTQRIFVIGGTAVGSARIATSTDGITWTANTQSAISTSVSGLVYAKNASLWVAVGLGTNQIATATDPAGTWTGVTNVMFNSANGAAAVTFSPTIPLFCAGGVATPNNIATAPAAGTPWTGRGNIASFNAQTVFGVHWGNGTFIASAGVASTKCMSRSPDGIAWTSVAVNIFSSFGFCTHYAIDRNIWLAGGNGGNSLAYSFDNGVTWTGSANGNNIMVQGRGIASRVSNTTTNT